LEKADIETLGDLILNESFREFVENKNPESVKIWNDYITNNPDKKKETEDAVNVLKTLLKKRKAHVPADKNDALTRLMKIIDEEKPGTRNSIKNFNSIWVRIAAVGLLILGLSSLWNVFHPLNINNQDLAYNEIIVPLGEKAQIVLSDGSHVWINSASKLRYPVQFGEISREVTLEGEAFFEVTKKNGKTFVVNTQDVKVNVLGTAFNVRCYPGDKKTQTTVVRGKVKVEEIHGNQKAMIIKPNEMVTLTEKVPTGQQTQQIPSFTINKVDPNNLVSWKDQMLVFAGESFEDLAIKMERWYNVKIKIDNEELKSERFSGKFVHNETVYQVLEAIKITTPISFRVEKDTIVISKINRKYHNP
jgi:ferric-dicitrate binding protein FerR (iron transport regulator)